MRLFALLVLFAFPAAAWPVDWIHDVEAGKEKFVKLPQVDWIEVDDPKVVSVEWIEESKELLLIGLKPGRATVLLGAQGKVAAWRVRVGGATLIDAAAMTAAQKVCPDFKATPLDDPKLAVTVHDEACRKALLALFQTDAFEARSIELTFDGKVLQTQLKAVQEALLAITKGRVKARYVGAGLVIEGNVTVAEHRKILWELLKRSLGRFALDDQMVLPEEPADAGK
ncbi:MAG: pilus assembly protein N-terminal domain-containing protein [Archangium sp.]